MQESQLPQTPTPKTTLDTLFPSQNDQDFIFNASKEFYLSSFSAFKLVRSCDDQNVSQSSDSSIQGQEKRSKRGSYRRYTLEEKEQAVKKIQNGYDVKEISKEYNIPRRNLLRWKKNGCERKEGGGRPTDNQLQNILYFKIVNKELKSQKEIRQQAKKLSRCQNFKASKGWYSKFHKRFSSWQKNNQNQISILSGLTEQSYNINIEKGQLQNQ